MKKSIILVLAVFLLFGINAKAMTKSDLEAKLTSSYTINGVVFSANDSQKAQIRRYLAQNDISESDCDFIALEVDKAIQVIDESNAKSFSTMSQAYKNKLSQIAAEISKNTSVKVTLASNGTLSVYNIDGTLFTKISSTIKNTSNLEVLYIAGAISAVGALYFANKVRKANN
ncbi:MAG: hypothetical protein IJ572_01210 [Bacilli bacterium]|nr:hypothetical protein [Bacilli bacterium]